MLRVKCVLCVVYQVDLSLQFVAMCYSVGLPYEREISQLKDCQQSTCTSRTSAKKSSRAVFALLLLLTQDIHKGNGSPPPVVFVLTPSGSLTVLLVDLDVVTGDLVLFPEARPCQSTYNTSPQSETTALINLLSDCRLEL